MGKNDVVQDFSAFYLASFLWRSNEVGRLGLRLFAMTFVMIL